MNLMRFGEYFVEETRGDMRHGSWFWGRWGMMNSVEGCEGDDCGDPGLLLFWDWAKRWA